MRNLFAFIWRNQFFFLFLVLEVIAFVMIINQTIYQRSLFLSSSSQIAGSLYSSISNFKDYFKLRHTNELLSRENALLLNQNQQLRLVTQDTTSRIFTDQTKQGQYQYIAARVLSNTVIHRNNYLLLDKGRLQGIDKDMAVVSSEGIVGIVINASANFCWVMSVLNENTKINGKLKKSNFQGSLSWSGTNYRTGTLSDLPAHVELTTGDTIVTSGYSLMFPEGIMIGTIEEFNIGKGDHFYTVRVRFSTDFNRITYVYIVKNLYRQEQLSVKQYL